MKLNDIGDGICAAEMASLPLNQYHLPASFLSSFLRPALLFFECPFLILEQVLFYRIIVNVVQRVLICLKASPPLLVT